MISTAKKHFLFIGCLCLSEGGGAFLFIILARYLGADNFGKYTFAISFAALFSSFNRLWSIF